MYSGSSLDSSLRINCISFHLIIILIFYSIDYYVSIPLFITYVLFMYFVQAPGCTTLWDILRAVLFIDNFWQSAMDQNCSGSGWSLSLEMHTCLIIMLLF
eukprot:210746_1